MTLLVRGIIAVFSVLTCCSCATTRRAQIGATGSISVTPQPPDLFGVLRLMGRYSMAHGCPIEAKRGLTNAHVVDGQRGLVDTGALPFVWEAAGASGLVGATQVARFRDLAELVPQGERFPRWYPVANEAPRPGDPVWFVGYDWSNRKNAFAERVFTARVVRVVGGHLVMDKAGQPGSSGSCVLNAAGQVLAINQGSMAVSEGTDSVGVAVGVWGPLLELGK